jgi:hypothetical protein
MNGVVFEKTHTTQPTQEGMALMLLQLPLSKRKGPLHSIIAFLFYIF